MAFLFKEQFQKARSIMRHPIQPVAADKFGTLRFKENTIVSYLLESGTVDMNKLAIMQFPREDREQFAQLIGYSLSGFSELGYVSSDTYETALRMAEREQSEADARITVLEEKLAATRKALRAIVPELFQVHPDDLIE